MRPRMTLDAIQQSEFLLYLRNSLVTSLWFWLSEVALIDCSLAMGRS